MEKTDKTTSTTETESTIKVPEKRGMVQVHNTFLSFILSKKLWMTVFSIILLYVIYWRQVNYLYSFTDPNQLNVFSGITRDFMVAITGCIMAYLGVQGFVEWRHGTSTLLNQATSFVQKKSEEHITRDINEHIIEEGKDGSPEVRPFSTIALENDLEMDND